MTSAVSVHREPVVLPTYEPQDPDRNPMFLEKRVYQGSSGRVYPLPFIDRIAEKATPHTWEALFIENEFLRVMILPELGGRIHRLIDKTNGYDLIYHQAVIKPALVGLAGPWVSGGIEFNWPQHHRPATYMPVDTHVEQHPDGAATVWLSDHDPMARMKGMHGVCLYPDRAYMELKVRAYNRTDDVQTFLWWANVATRVHERYQSFFPPDVRYVADHARRAMSTYPLSSGRYYGVDYAERGRAGGPLSGTQNPNSKSQVPNIGTQTQNPKLRISELGVSGTEAASRLVPSYAANDLSWYANIPVPTSYMCMGSREDFFGGYDYAAQAGLVHIADHHIAPGKKQWTWGNHAFGYAWDRNLTEPDAQGVCWPYIELMAGVYTDNQPDFSFLQPGETKAWSQYWYPIRAIGPAQHANLDGAVSLCVDGVSVRVGVAVSAPQSRASVRLESRGRLLEQWTPDLRPDQPLVAVVKLRRRTPPTDLTLRVTSADGRELFTYTPQNALAPLPPEVLSSMAASEPSAAAEMSSADELFLTGLHLEQYRHATRMPETYWAEGLRRDSGDARCNMALGRWHLRRGEFEPAEKHLRASIARLTLRNANPADGEPFYQLGRCLVHQASRVLPVRLSGHVGDNALNPENDLLAEAYDAFYKATWNQAWQAAGFHALAEIAGARHEWDSALGHIERALRVNSDNLRARDLKVIILRHLKREAEATALLRATLALDPLDWWAHHLNGGVLRCNTQTRLDLALDYARAGCFSEALDVLGDARPEAHSGTAPLVGYYRGWLLARMGDHTAARRAYAAAAEAPPACCFPARLEEIGILETAIGANPRDARAPFYLGNLLYDRRRHREAIDRWEQAARLEPENAVVWRNLGIGYFNIVCQPAKARAAYDRAFSVNPSDARLLFERDQLWKRLGESPRRRLRELEQYPRLVQARDDLAVELASLYNQTGQSERALAVVAGRRFQPWEGGEGQALGQHVRTHLILGRRVLAGGDPAAARREFKLALTAPENLGEAKHLLANQSDIHFWLGEAYVAAGDAAAARNHWTEAANFQGDFQAMSVRMFSEMTYYSALAWRRLGQPARARRLLRALLAHAQALVQSPVAIDYFATSLPTMLLFDDDLQARQTMTARLLEAQARLGLGEPAEARRLLRAVLRRDPSHGLAADLLASMS